MGNKQKRWLLAVSLGLCVGLPAAAQAGDDDRRWHTVRDAGKERVETYHYRDRDERHHGRDHPRGRKHDGHYDRHRYSQHKYRHHRGRHHWRKHYRHPPIIWRHFGHDRHGYHRHGGLELHFHLDDHH